MITEEVISSRNKPAGATWTGPGIPLHKIKLYSFAADFSTHMCYGAMQMVMDRTNREAACTKYLAILRKDELGFDL